MIKRNKYLLAAPITIIVIILLVRIFLLFYIPIALHAIGEEFGVVPLFGGCAGILISQDKTRLLPNGDINFGIMRYHVSSDLDEKYYCIGQDYWYGE